MVGAVHFAAFIADLQPIKPDLWSQARRLRYDPPAVPWEFEGTLMLEEKLLDKLRAIEALFAGAATPGEKDAAGHARQRILNRMKSWERRDPPVEHQFSLSDPWARKVFVALLRRYKIEPYRRLRQRRTTVMARVSRGFVEDTLWPEFQQISATLETHLSEITDRVISTVIHRNSSDAELIETPKQLPADSR